MTRYFISACLLGQRVRYDGQDCLIKELLSLHPEQYISACPETIGGLPTPRPPAEIQSGDGHDVLKHHAKVIDLNGKDVSAAFIQGAYQTLKIAQDFHVTHAVLKSNSPSCGHENIYDGSFRGHKILGDGVTAALFKQHGITVLTEQEFLAHLNNSCLKPR